MNTPSSTPNSSNMSGAASVPFPTGADVRAAFDRAMFVMQNPKTCWDTIAAEPSSVQKLYTKYVMLLALIPAICGLIGGLIQDLPTVTILTAVIMYIVSLAILYVDGLVVQFVSSKFGGSSDLVGSLKLLAYSFTPTWLAGVLSLFPILPILGLLFMIYSIYIYFQGPTKVLAIPADKRVGFVVVSILAIIVVQIVVGGVVGLLLLGSTLLA